MPTTAPETTRERILHTAGSIMAKKGYAAVGINEVLAASQVPKGSFYHYFASKDAFGEAMLQDYFDAYLADVDRMLSAPGLTTAERLMTYWQSFADTQETYECQGRCLVVKLGAEVADLSEPMRLVLRDGTDGITSRLTAAITAGVADGSLTIDDDPARLARTLYSLWLGASVMGKMHRDPQPLSDAMAMTTRLLAL